MSNLFVSYINLSVDLENHLVNATHKTIVGALRNHFLNWKGFFEKYGNYNLGFIIVTKREVIELEVKGPSISRKMKVVDFSIFLPKDIEKLQPDKSEDIDQYLEWIFSGIFIAVAKFDVPKSEIDTIKKETKDELNMPT